MQRITLGTIAFITIFISACQNDNTVNPRPTEEIVSKVTISGKVKADLVTTNAVYESVPNGLKVVAAIRTSDLVLRPSSSADYVYKYYEGTTTNGEYNIEVEAGPYGSSVTVYFPDFRADVSNDKSSTSTLFVGSERLVKVLKGTNRIVDFNY